MTLEMQIMIIEHLGIGLTSGENVFMVGCSETRLGDFWKLLVTHYTTIVAQMYDHVWAILENITTKWKLLWLVFFVILEKFWVLIISTSGHTGVRTPSP